MRFEKYSCELCGCSYVALIINDKPKHLFCPCCEHGQNCLPEAMELLESERCRLKWYLCPLHHWDDVVIAVGADYAAGVHICPVCGDDDGLQEVELHEIYFGEE